MDTISIWDSRVCRTHRPLIRPETNGNKRSSERRAGRTKGEEDLIEDTFLAEEYDTNRNHTDHGDDNA